MHTHTHIDRGGTFTDIVYRTPDGVEIRKVPSNVAVMGELTRGALTFGTTVATNALLEGRGVRVALFVTRGFADLPWIRDQTRPDLFDLDASWPVPLVRRTDVFEVEGHIDPAGQEVEPLVIPALDREALAACDVACIALVNSHANAAHELQLARALPFDFITLGHQVSPGLGYLMRIETALVDAAITPILQSALARDAVPHGALAMQSDGSLCPADALRAPDAVLSGPAGGVIAVEAIARQAGFRSAVGLDMGGTSTDVCRVDVGALPRRDGTHIVAGVRLSRPVLEVETIAAGGGSVLAHDGLQLTVGPASAGADPGPQAYGLGGPPTLTDAALIAGLIDPARFPLPLDLAAIALPGDAEAFLTVARDAMAHAIQRLATARGVDVADHALVAYGGASGQHAVFVAERLGIGTVLVHPCASVLCAWGQAMARREETAMMPLWSPLTDGLATARQHAAALLERLDPLDEQRLTLALRPLGTDATISVAVEPDDRPADLAARYATLHQRRYGVALGDAVLEIAHVRVRTRAHRLPLDIAATDPWKLGTQRILGPKRLTSTTTSVIVPTGWTAQWRDGLLWLEQHHPVSTVTAATERTPLQVTLWASRFQAVATEAGAVLERLARSVNIRERRDYSCALFDGAGRLVANAPHIPVHLGAMGETVRDLVSRADRGELTLDPQQAWVCNDPAAGGSHLPDLTVTSVVHHEGARFFVASRGHHVDVGGLTPGSMPPRSVRLTDEGVVLRQLALKDASGRFRNVALREALASSRQPDTVLADLSAQVAANAHAANALKRLGSADVIAVWMNHLRDVAQEATAAALERLADGDA
ncbi:MAG: 5-oxoprolinase (ATP-hydrolyzing), partial [Myxococcota bacterium]